MTFQLFYQISTSNVCTVVLGSGPPKIALTNLAKSSKISLFLGRRTWSEVVDLGYQDNEYRKKEVEAGFRRIRTNARKTTKRARSRLSTSWLWRDDDNKITSTLIPWYPTWCIVVSAVSTLIWFSISYSFSTVYLLCSRIHFVVEDTKLPWAGALLLPLIS